MLYFCTLFHSNYAAKGLTLYRSLKGVCSEFRLFVFAFDDELAFFLKRMALPEIVVITLAEFEDPDLLRVKPTRSVAEYCWTCTSSTMLYCLNHFDIDHCTYLDADLFFYQNPQLMIDEMGDDDILITPHWFAPDNDNSEEVGKFCVQFVTARRTPNAMSVLSEWRDECIEWCFSHHQGGKLGDQKYLDKWPDVHTGICVSSHMGGGVAPWNMERYRFRRKRGVLYATEKRLGYTFPVIFCHFHFVYAFMKGFIHNFSFDTYRIEKNCSEMTFMPYCKELKQSYKALKRIGFTYEALGLRKEESTWASVFRKWMRMIWRIDYCHYWWI